MNKTAVLSSLAIAAGSLLAAQQPRAVDASRAAPIHLAATSKTVVWGNYWSESKPALRVNSGQTVVVDTLTTASPTLETRNGIPDDKVEPALKEVFANFPRDQRGPGSHILTGPIYVEGAEPGDTLAIHILKYESGSDYAINTAGGRSGFVPQDFNGQHGAKAIPLDWKTMKAHFAPGIDIPMHPFLGSIGDAPPPEMGKLSSLPPTLIGGNMDNKDLVAGTTLFLPVWVPGALVEFGDGHAGQGDGELDGDAMETSLRGTFRLEVIKNTGLKFPRAETPTDYISMGFNRDLTAAATQAVEQMIDFLVNTQQVTKLDALQLCSFACNVHITEVVDQNMGVHVLFSKAVFEKAKR